MFRADFTIADAAEVSLIEYTRLSLSPFHFAKSQTSHLKKIDFSRKSVIHRQEQSWPKGKSFGCFYMTVVNKFHCNISAFFTMKTVTLF